MSELGQLSGLIGDAYDAALDAAAWPQALGRTLAVVGGCSALLYAQNAQLAAGNFQYSVGTDPRLCGLHLRHYQRELSACEQGVSVGAVFAVSDTLPIERLQATAFYREWAAPQGYVDFLGVVLERSAGSLVRLFINRSERQGRVDERARGALRLLVPHFQRAMRIGQSVERSASKAAVLTEVLDGLSIGAICVDCAGRFLYANRAGLQRLADGEAVLWVNGRPRPRDAASASQWEAVLASAVRRAPRSADGGHGAAELPARRARLKVQGLALATGAGRGVRPPCSAAAVLLIARRPPDLAELLESAARRYEFTPAELRVVQALMDGCSIGRIARQLSIGEATVKTHLQHVFDKTAARRQADLIKLIADPVPPPAPALAALTR